GCISPATPPPRPPPSPLELPPRRRAFEVAMHDPERPYRPDPKARVHSRIERVDLVVRLVLGVLEREQLGDVCGVGEQLSSALDHNWVGGILGGDDAPSVGGQVLRLARRLAATEPESAVVPHPPHRHRMRSPVWP